jgi:hypothetical protein
MHNEYMDFLLEVNLARVVETLRGVVIGGLISSWTAFIVASRQSERELKLQKSQQAWDREQQRDQWIWEKEQRRDQVQYERAMEADRYQRETLGELQPLLDELVITARAIAIEKREMLVRATPEERATDEVETTEHYQEIAARYRAAAARIKVLAVRIEDDEVRGLLDSVYSLAWKLFDRPPGFWEELRRAGIEKRIPDFEIVELSEQANQLIGQRLRDWKSVELSAKGSD